jgi:sterol desaturase/sphingolipid hydroxylase (fatty acid hydroxylase superfamily)
LIFFFGLFKKGRILVLKFLFKTREIEERFKNRLDVKIAAGGLLISVIAIVVGLIYALINDILIGPSTAPFSTLLSTFSSGNWTLFIGVALFAGIAISLFLVYFWKNGYYLILKIMGTLEK